MDDTKRKISTTTNGQPPAEGLENGSAPQPINPTTGQHGAYWVLSEEERSKGFIRPVRSSYVHDRGPVPPKCRAVTTMGRAIAETYASDPGYYSHTFCIGCREHLPVSEFSWTTDGSVVGS